MSRTRTRIRTWLSLTRTKDSNLKDQEKDQDLAVTDRDKDSSVKYKDKDQDLAVTDKDKDLSVNKDKDLSVKYTNQDTGPGCQ